MHPLTKDGCHAAEPAAVRIAPRPPVPSHQDTSEEDDTHDFAINNLPVSNQLTLVQDIGDPAYSSDLPGTVTPNPSISIPTDRHQPPILICNGLPPIPLRLVKRVEEGLFIEMSELLPKRLSSADFNAGDQAPSTKHKPPEVSNIIDWVQCFGLYIIIISCTQPTRIADLIGYQ